MIAKLKDAPILLQPGQSRNNRDYSHILYEAYCQINPRGKGRIKPYISLGRGGTQSASPTLNLSYLKNI